MEGTFATVGFGKANRGMRTFPATRGEDYFRRQSGHFRAWTGYLISRDFFRLLGACQAERYVTEYD